MQGQTNMVIKKNKQAFHILLVVKVIQKNTETKLNKQMVDRWYSKSKANFDDVAENRIFSSCGNCELPA